MDYLEIADTPTQLPSRRSVSADPPRAGHFEPSADILPYNCCPYLVWFSSTIKPLLEAAIKKLFNYKIKNNLLYNRRNPT